MGEMACAWFGKIPVVERENHGDDATLHQLCYYQQGQYSNK
jgi:hypothetical protein